MSQLIDHTFVITGNEQALDQAEEMLNALQMEYPEVDGIMEWSTFERSPGCLEFNLMDSHYFEHRELTPKLMKWSSSIDVVIQRYSWTEDSDRGAWTARIKQGKSEVVADWDWPHPSYVQIPLLSLGESPTPEVVISLIQQMPDFLCEGSACPASGVGIAEALVDAFESSPELLDIAAVQTAMLEVEEHAWSDEDIEDVLFLNDPEEIEPLLQFYRLRENFMLERHLPPGRDSESRAA